MHVPNLCSSFTHDKVGSDPQHAGRSPPYPQSADDKGWHDTLITCSPSESGWRKIRRLERVRSRTSVASDEPPDVAIRRFRDADDPRDLGWVVLTVLDASAAIAVSLNLGASGSAILERLDGSYEGPHVSHSFGVEVLRALRLHALGLSEKRGANFFEDLTSMRLKRYPHIALVGRMWELNENFTFKIPST